MKKLIIAVLVVALVSLFSLPAMLYAESNEKTASLTIEIAPAGQGTKFHVSAKDAEGESLILHIYIAEEYDQWLARDFADPMPDPVAEFNIDNIPDNDWSVTWTHVFSEEGDYVANLFGFFGPPVGAPQFSTGPQYFTVPPAEPEPVIPRPRPRPTPIDRLPIGRYEATATGFTTFLYNRILGRAPEQEGLDAWLALLDSGAVTGADMVYRFILGEECQAKISEYTNEEFITFLYRVLFNREPEEAGFNAWLERMAATMTREEVVERFTHSEEFINLCNEFGIIPYEGYTVDDE